MCPARRDGDWMPLFVVLAPGRALRTSCSADPAGSAGLLPRATSPTRSSRRRGAAHAYGKLLEVPVKRLLMGPRDRGGEPGGTGKPGGARLVLHFAAERLAAPSALSSVYPVGRAVASAALEQSGSADRPEQDGDPDEEHDEREPVDHHALIGERAALEERDHRTGTNRIATQMFT